MSNAVIVFRFWWWYMCYCFSTNSVVWFSFVCVLFWLLFIAWPLIVFVIPFKTNVDSTVVTAVSLQSDNLYSAFGSTVPLSTYVPTTSDIVSSMTSPATLIPLLANSCPTSFLLCLICLFLWCRLMLLFQRC